MNRLVPNAQVKDNGVTEERQFTKLDRAGISPDLQSSAIIDALTTSVDLMTKENAALTSRICIAEAIIMDRLKVKREEMDRLFKEFEKNSKK